MKNAVGNGKENLPRRVSALFFACLFCLFSVLPLSIPGVTTGITMVFVPSVSTFIISRMLGGGSNMMVGDLIETQFLGNAYNPNLGSAISLVLMVFILLVMSLMNQFEDSEDREGMMV